MVGRRAADCVRWHGTCFDGDVMSCGRRQVWFKRGIAFVGPLAVLGAWSWITRHPGQDGAQVLVSPGQVYAALHELWTNGQLLTHLRQSPLRLAVGFGIGAGLGLMVGLMMGLSRTIEEVVGPTFHAIRQVPSIAFIPMMILVFGIEETFKIVVVAKAAFFPVALAAADGIKAIPRGFLEVGQVYGLRGLTQVRCILLPAILPSVVTGLRIALGRSWTVLVAAEIIASESGLGQMMEMGRQTMRQDVVLLGVFITGVFGFLLDRSMRLLEGRLAAWRTA
jgi:sulfonate transport system permease protein